MDYQQRLAIRQWVLSFLAVDAVFWLLVAGTCIFNSVECADFWAFGSYSYYLPFSKIAFPWYTAVWSQHGVIIVEFLTLISCHALLGAAMGWLVRNRKFNWLQMIVASFGIVLIVAGVFGQISRSEEIERETSTQLWNVYAIDAESATFRVAHWRDDNSAQPPFFSEEDRETSQALDNTNRTEVQLLCFSDQCSQDVDGYSVLSFAEFLQARQVCVDAPLDCPYYSLSTTPMLFDVTLNPQGIVLMKEHYLP